MTNDDLCHETDLASRDFAAGRHMDGINRMVAAIKSAHDADAETDALRVAFGELARMLAQVHVMETTPDNAASFIANLSGYRGTPYASEASNAYLDEAVAIATQHTDGKASAVGVLLGAADVLARLQGPTSPHFLRCLRQSAEWLMELGEFVTLTMAFNSAFGTSTTLLKTVADSCDDGAVVCAYFAWNNGTNAGKLRLGRDAGSACLDRLRRLADHALSTGGNLNLVHRCAMTLMAASHVPYWQAADLAGLEKRAALLDEAENLWRTLRDDRADAEGPESPWLPAIDAGLREINAFRNRSVSYLVWDDVRDTYLPGIDSHSTTS